MEKDRFGINGNADASCRKFSRSFSLDLESTLEAAEAALHHQICESLQGPTAVQENLQHTLQQGYLSFPAPYTFGSTEPFQFLSGGALHADMYATSAEHRLPDNRFPVLNPGSHVQSSVQRKQFTAGGFALEERLVTASMRSSAAPDHLSSMDHAIINPFDRALFQLDAPVQPSVYYAAAPGDQACTPNIPREFSTSEPYHSPENAASRNISFQPCQSQKAEGVLTVQDRRTTKPKRAFDQPGHVIRERLRRDDMSSKFLLLESILPPGPKRDRATIVEHSIRYVKNLHHRVKDLQQKRSEMKKVAGAMIALGRKQQMRPPEPRKKLPTVHSLEMDKIAGETSNDAKAQTSIEKVEVHLNLPEEIVIEMTCRLPAHHFQSQVLGALEFLRMDVLQCSISKSHGLVLCSLVVQPREIFGSLVTSDDIIRALKQAIEQP